MIDRDGEDEKVYFLTEVSENDLLNTTTDNSETLPKNSAALESAIPTKDSALSNNNDDTTGEKTQGAEVLRTAPKIARKIQVSRKRIPQRQMVPALHIF